MDAKSQYTWGTGRRKSSVARVRIRPGSGEITVNRRSLPDYFPNLGHRIDLEAPLKATSSRDKYDVFVNVLGGGITGQAGACALGIARALRVDRPEFEERLRDGGHLTRDGRMKERKKYGRRGARRGFQFSKR
ncbi:MAG: 30S ribosomal protein S9 [Planctomycetes bacterium]|nr:30S ribosomal protein S9 [Planctomycetota bacterium]